MITTLPVVVLSATVIMSFTNRIRQVALSLRRARRSAILCLAVAVPLMFIINSGLYTAFQATATFDRRLMALAPVISDQERKSLLGQWAMMKGRADYDKINAKFQELAEKYHSELPPPYI